MNAAPDGCTDGCIGGPDEHASEGDSATAERDAEPTGEHFAEAVAMLARLTLTDAERAEAVRRLLAGANDRPPKGKP